MRRELARLSVILAVGLIFGLLTEQVLACLCVALSLYIVILLRQLWELLQHLKGKGDSRTEIETTGIIENALREYERLRRHSHNRSANLLSHLKRFQLATNALPDAVVLLGEYGSIEWANVRAGEYLGVNWPQDEGFRIANLLRDPRLSDLLQLTESSFGENRIELALLTNQERYLELRIVPYSDKHRLLVARDITEIHNTTQMRKDFIANASHELRTPLTVVLGYLETLEHDRGSDQASGLGSIISKMRKHTVRMQRLIDDLLRLSSMESMRSRWEEVLVSDMLTTIFNEAKVLSDEMGHIFYLETNSDLWIRGNYQELYSAFSNLVFNAVQYTPPRGIIRVRWYEVTDGACLDVTDTGEGIASEHVPRLTERFYRVDKGRSRDKGGTGLGLAIVKHALSNHGASLKISSRLGQGSTFQCHFPKENLVYKTGSGQSSVSA
ncbi:MAG: phosphate regulon sensor histidine kinase PhoR [Thiotrichales bacterium]|nr:phosphate regulon sensor histidine kinase PhoR [Thiotrichales bacterium]